LRLSNFTTRFCPVAAKRGDRNPNSLLYILLDMKNTASDLETVFFCKFKLGFIGEIDMCTFLSLSREKYQKSAT